MNEKGHIMAPQSWLLAVDFGTSNTVSAQTDAIGGTISTLPIAAILSAVLARAVAAHAGQPPARPVLTHPEGWSPQEIQVLLSAAGRLGFTSDRVTKPGGAPATVPSPQLRRADHFAGGGKFAQFLGRRAHTRDHPHRALP